MFDNSRAGLEAAGWTEVEPDITVLLSCDDELRALLDADDPDADYFNGADAYGFDADRFGVVDGFDTDPFDTDMDADDLDAAAARSAGPYRGPLTGPGPLTIAGLLAGFVAELPADRDGSLFSRVDPAVLSDAALIDLVTAVDQQHSYLASVRARALAVLVDRDEPTPGAAAGAGAGLVSGSAQEALMCAARCSGHTAQLGRVRWSV